MSIEWGKLSAAALVGVPCCPAAASKEPRPHYNNDGRKQKAGENPNRRGPGDVFSKNGVCEDRLRSLLHREACNCTKQCFRKFAFEPTLMFLQRLWSLGKFKQDVFLMSCGLSESSCTGRCDARIRTCSQARRVTRIPTCCIAGGRGSRKPLCNCCLVSRPTYRCWPARPTTFSQQVEFTNKT